MKHCNFSVPVIHLRQIDSTINYLEKLSNQTKLEELSSVIADYQTSGKGQRGNSWVSEEGMNLLFSFIIYPDFLVAKKQFYISKVVSLALKKTLDAYGKDFSIKWPNDMYWKDKKICGTLIENDLLGAIIQKSIAGIGVNVNQKDFEEGAGNPVSLFNITNQVLDISEVFHSIIENVSYYYNLLKEEKEGIIDELYHDSLYRKDGYYWYRDEESEFEARIVEVLPEGLLVLEDREGKRRQYAFKEVQYK
jgi:birA, biotin-[acetyl-CoA-carboxylase] ligase region